MCESVFKVLIIGDQFVGKTSMVARYCLNKWLPNYKATIGADYAVKSIKWSNTETVRLHLWDIAGQESFRAMTRTYFRGASGCVILFDVTDRNTFEHTRDWKADLDSKVVLPNGEPIPCILLANKDDLPNKVVTSHEIATYAKENGYFQWVFISVKENKNISEAMHQLVQQMLQQEHESGIVQQAEDRNVVKLDEQDNGGGRSGCCAR